MGDRRYFIAANAEVKVDGVSVGYTNAETTIKISREYEDVTVEQVKGQIASFLTNETCEVSTSLAEITMNNLKLVWDQEGSLLVGGTFLSLGTEDGANEHTIIITAKAPAGESYTYVNYYIFRGISYDAGDQAMSRGSITTIPVTFRCLKDDKNGNKFGYRELSNTKATLL